MFRGTENLKAASWTLAGTHMKKKNHKAVIFVVVVFFKLASCGGTCL